MAQDTQKELTLLAQRICALAGNGLTYSLSEYDTERYEELNTIGHKIAALATGVENLEDISNLYLNQKEYATLKVDIRAVVFNDKDEILLVKEKHDGCWSLPGGWADIGFSPGEVAIKEVKEETGLDVAVVRLLAMMDMSKHPHPIIPFYVYKTFILCRITGGAFNETFDILDKDFFPIDQLPSLSRERVLPQQIKQMYDLYRYPDKGVYLD
ncbi:MAG: NUDIX hydrolase [Tannerellaceae bacterium]|nr:NUDIX hydrolase [Tannerellaceae bacterium]